VKPHRGVRPAADRRRGEHRGVRAPVAAVTASAAEAEHYGRRALAGFLVDRLTGKESDVYQVAVRDIPQRRLLSLHRYVTPDELVSLGRDFIIRRMRKASVPSVAGIAGAPFVIYHGQVNADSDGPIDWCRPIPDDRADEIAPMFPDLTVRIEPAHQEAYVHLPSAEVGEAESILVLETLAPPDRRLHCGHFGYRR
jgi:hypothetical protein